MKYLYLLLSLLIALPAQAQLKIDITRGNVDPLPIAITNFTDKGQPSDIGRDMLTVITNNLKNTGLFRPIVQRSFIENVTDGNAVPRFADWRQVSAEALVTGTIVPKGRDQITVSFRLWDALGEQQIAGKEFNTYARNWRRIAHLISDEIYTRLTGEDGYFDSRIVYVAETGPKNRRKKRLAIMDQDGANHKYLTDGNHLVLTPRFSPSSQNILYMSYAGAEPRVYLRDLQTGREKVMGKFRGMSFAPRFANSGNRLVMSIANNGNTEVYDMSVGGSTPRKLTNSPAIDTSPSYSPDGKRIVFNSDRGGSQQLYVMNANGSGVKRISFGDGRYGTPVWSPRGDLIAFTKMKGGRFYIGVMRPDGTGERTLSESWLDEGPTWSPNGRVIMFFRQEPSGRTSLYSVDITGYNLRRVPTPTDASDPAWSPRLPL